MKMSMSNNYEQYIHVMMAFQSFRYDAEAKALAEILYKNCMHNLLEIRPNHDTVCLMFIWLHSQDFIKDFQCSTNKFA